MLNSNGNAAIRLGDSSTHGGKVTSADGSVTKGITSADGGIPIQRNDNPEQLGIRIIGAAKT